MIKGYYISSLLHNLFSNYYRKFMKFLYLEASEAKSVKSISNIIGVNSLRLKDLLLMFNMILIFNF